MPFRYQGQYYDEETGLSYNRFRYYDDNTGQYISQDPIGLAGGNPTIYGYVHDTNAFLDILGLNLVEHLFHGEINRHGQAVGFHYEGSIGSVGHARVTQITSLPDSHGVYTGRVEVFDQQTGTWIPKRTESTFFPKDMSRAQILNEVDEAFSNAQFNGRKWKGTSNSGITIGGYVDDNGNKTTAFPLLDTH